VQEIINAKKHQYVNYLYFNIEGISFADDVLKEVYVFGDKFDYRIPKPGKSVETYEKVSRIYFNICAKRYSPTRVTNTFKKRAKAKLMALNAQERLSFSKGNMQRINHGR